MSAERRCNHSAANSDDAQLFCALWNDSMAARKQSNAHSMDSVHAEQEAYLLESCGVHSSSHNTLVPPSEMKPGQGRGDWAHVR
jgi:hypothetical protein